jgi:hypothetical protein
MKANEGTASGAIVQFIRRYGGSPFSLGKPTPSATATAVITAIIPPPARRAAGLCSYMAFRATPAGTNILAGASARQDSPCRFWIGAAPDRTPKRAATRRAFAACLTTSPIFCDRCGSSSRRCRFSWAAYRGAANPSPRCNAAIPVCATASLCCVPASVRRSAPAARNGSASSGRV